MTIELTEEEIKEISIALDARADQLDDADRAKRLYDLASRIRDERVCKLQK